MTHDGQKGRHFDVGGNRAACFTIATATDVPDPVGETWLKGEFVGPGGNEPLFNGRLFHSAGTGQTMIIDNFPKSDAPSGWTKRIRLDAQGYELVDDMGHVVFSYWDKGAGDVQVSLRLYGAGGQLIAATSDEGLHLSGAALEMDD